MNAYLRPGLFLLFLDLFQPIRFVVMHVGILLHEIFLQFF